MNRYPHNPDPVCHCGFLCGYSVAIDGDLPRASEIVVLHMTVEHDHADWVGTPDWVES